MVDESRKQLEAELITCYDYFSQLDEIEEKTKAAHITSLYLSGNIRELDRKYGKLSHEVTGAIDGLADAYIDAKGKKTLDDPEVRKYVKNDAYFQDIVELRIKDLSEEYKTAKKSKGTFAFLHCLGRVASFLRIPLFVILAFLVVIAIPVFSIYLWITSTFWRALLLFVGCELAAFIIFGITRHFGSSKFAEKYKEYHPGRAQEIEKQLSALKNPKSDDVLYLDCLKNVVDSTVDSYNRQYYMPEIQKTVDERYDITVKKRVEYIDEIGPRIKSQLKEIPGSYFKQEDIYGLLALYMNKRANNITDLINLYETEKFRSELVDTLSDNTAQIASLRKEMSSWMSSINSRLETANASINRMHQGLHEDYQQLTEQAKMLAIDSSMNSDYKDYLVSVNGETFNVKTYS